MKVKFSANDNTLLPSIHLLDGSVEIQLPDDTIKLVATPQVPLYNFEGGTSTTQAYYLVPRDGGRYYCYVSTQRHGWDGGPPQLVEVRMGFETIGCCNWLKKLGYSL